MCTAEQTCSLTGARQRAGSAVQGATTWLSPHPAPQQGDMQPAAAPNARTCGPLTPRNAGRGGRRGRRMPPDHSPASAPAPDPLQQRAAPDERLEAWMHIVQSSYALHGPKGTPQVATQPRKQHTQGTGPPPPTHPPTHPPRCIACIMASPAFISATRTRVLATCGRGGMEWWAAMVQCAGN
jgi:hypothetical protein